MNTTAIGLIVIFLVVGCVLGWYSERTRQGHSDVKVAKTRLRGGRATRWRAGVTVLIIGIIVLLAVRDVLHPR